LKKNYKHSRDTPLTLDPIHPISLLNWVDNFKNNSYFYNILFVTLFFFYINQCRILINTQMKTNMKKYYSQKHLLFTA